MFSYTVKPLKPMLERVKGGEPVVFGGLPLSSFEKLVEDGALRQVESTACGWRWPLPFPAKLCRNGAKGAAVTASAQ